MPNCCKPEPTVPLVLIPSYKLATKTQYTPPTRLNCRVASRRRCVLGIRQAESAAATAVGWRCVGSGGFFMLLRVFIGEWRVASIVVVWRLLQKQAACIRLRANDHELS